MLRETLIAMRDLPRLKEISGILIRHGLGEFAQRLKLPRAVEKAGQWLNLNLPEAENRPPTPVRVRLALKNWAPPSSSWARFFHPRGRVPAGLDRRV